MQRYHTLAKNEQWFCAAKVLSRPCLSWVIFDQVQRGLPIGPLSPKSENSASAFGEEGILEFARTNKSLGLLAMSTGLGAIG